MLFDPIALAPQTKLSQSALYNYLKQPKKLTLWRVEVIARAMKKDPVELAAQILNDSELVVQPSLASDDPSYGRIPE